MNKLLHVLSVTGTFMMLFGFIFIALELAFGFIPLVRSACFMGMPLAEPIFAAIDLMIIRKFIRISSPYKG